MSVGMLFVALLSVLAYMIVGIQIFHALESDKEIERQRKLMGMLQLFLAEHRCLDKQTLMRLMDYIDRDLDTARYVLYHNVTYNVMWDWAGAASFVVSVITTIGYGHITPRTDEGKVACMIYAMVGIPLLLVFLKGAGELLCQVCSRCLQPSRRCCPDASARSKLLRRVHAILQSVVGLSVLFLLPCIFYVHTEHWSTLDAVYYYFVTLTTIGFGDLLPANPADRKTFEISGAHLAFRLANLLWTLVGLAYLSMLITAISNFYVRKSQGVQTEAQKKMEKLRLRMSRKLKCRRKSGADAPTPPPTPTLFQSLSVASLQSLELTDNVASDVQVRLLACSPLRENSSLPGRTATAVPATSSSAAAAAAAAAAVKDSVSQASSSSSSSSSASLSSSANKKPSAVAYVSDSVTQLSNGIAPSSRRE
ncbi:potassium channel, subfamily K, member 16-like isoform X2 [Babylonia areolata]|uniref:potassium channel, subfamily K, member 16-like isoform X2 n=1 Tax=Babylonia areolata TaxID=304850 RepID=UPI003FD0687A